MAAMWRDLLLNAAADMDDADHDRQLMELRRERKLLRDAYNPFEMRDEDFVKIFRLTRDVCVTLCDRLRPTLEPFKLNGISVEKKVLAALQFYASGSFQLSVGQNFFICLSQSSVSRCVAQVSTAINNVLLGQCIKFPVENREQAATKHGFMEAFIFSGVVGVIDCTHIKPNPPPSNNPHMPENLFVNRRGFHPLNVQLICDANLRIINVNARFGGASHYSFIWRNRTARVVMENNYIHNGPSSLLLGDSGYPLELWLLTPVLNALPGSPEFWYTERLTQARCCVERCYGVLKSRFRCLLSDRVLHYKPQKAAKIVNACAVLHNLAIDAGIPIPDELVNDVNVVPINAMQENHREGARVRNAVIQQHFA